jgi:5'-deoxynucleotidase YfbR-like HD superfamily hydrolase
MTISDIQHQILTSDTFVLEEAAKIRALYGLRDVIRYDRTREEDIYTQSVAEHTFNMQAVAQYFLALEDTSTQLDAQKIFRMITWHDIGEIESGDVLGFLKTAQDKANDAAGNKKVIAQAPAVLQPEMQTLIVEYEAQKTLEAKFVKAIDKVEVIFEICDENYRKIFKINGTTTQHYEKTKSPYVLEYPYMRRFVDVIAHSLTEQGYFVDKPKSTKDLV